MRSSGVMVPSVFSSAETDPLLPSAATRTDFERGFVVCAREVGEDLLFKLCDVGHPAPNI